MGRKVHPLGFRLGYNKDWYARWYAEGRRYGDLLHEDLAIRRMIHETLGQAAISKIEIERYPKQIRVTIHSAKPGVVIGRKGQNIATLRDQLEELTKKKVWVEVSEIEHPELEAALIADSIVEQLEKRVSHKRAMKQAVMRAMRAGAKGIKILCSGRLAGAEMARSEWVREGRVPLQTLRADIDYACREALTVLGRIGVKVWVYRGDLLPEGKEEAEVPALVAEA
ncbi:MAG: 30S ribosomal protein S3 [Anaerolineae bacterium]